MLHLCPLHARSTTDLADLLDSCLLLREPSPVILLSHKLAHRPIALYEASCKDECLGESWFRAFRGCFGRVGIENPIVVLCLQVLFISCAGKPRTSLIGIKLNPRML